MKIIRCALLAVFATLPALQFAQPQVEVYESEFAEDSNNHIHEEWHLRPYDEEFREEENPYVQIDGLESETFIEESNGGEYYEDEEYPVSTQDEINRGGVGRVYVYYGTGRPRAYYNRRYFYHRKGYPYGPYYYRYYYYPYQRSARYYQRGW